MSICLGHRQAFRRWQAGQRVLSADSRNQRRRARLGRFLTDWQPVQTIWPFFCLFV